MKITSLPPMRRAAIITGLVFSLAVACGMLLRLFHLPGGIALVFFGTGLFFLIFSPLHAMYRHRTAQTKIGKAASIMGGIAGSIIGISYVFLFQRYPFGMHIFWLGIFLIVPFLIVYAISIFNKNYSAKRFGIFDVIVLTLLASYFINKNISSVSATDTEKQIAENEIARIEGWELGDATEETYSKIVSDTNAVAIQSAIQVHEETKQIVEFIYKIQAELISQHMGISPKIADTIRASLITNPSDFDYSTHYFIGADPRNVTGKAKELKEKIIVYYDHIAKLVPDTFQQNFKLYVRPFFPAEIYLEEHERNVSWEWYHFYHMTIIECHTTLERLKIDIRTVEKEALEKIQISSKN